MEPKDPHSGGAGASYVLGRNRQPSSTTRTIGATITGLPSTAILRVLRQHSRNELSGFIAVAIDLLDFADGDSDTEDATDAEDDFALSTQAIGYAVHTPGCPASEAADSAWVEWSTMRGSQKRGPMILPSYNEDDEDDDPAEANGDELDGSRSEDDFGLLTADWKGEPGCPIADPGGDEHDGREPCDDG